VSTQVNVSKKSLRIALLADAGHVNCQRWCEGLTNAGAEIHVLSFRSLPLDCVNSYQLPIYPFHRKLRYVTTVPHVRRLLAKIKPDVLLAYYVTGYGTLAALTNFRPLVQVTSGSDVLIAPRNAIMKLLLRHTLAKADLVTAWAPHMANATQELGVATERMLVLPRGIPFAQFASERSPEPMEGEPVSLISTRSLRIPYKIDLLLRAIAILKQRKVEFRLTIAGDGPEQGSLLGLAKQLGVSDNVRFVGFVPNADLPRLLAQHRIYISLIDSDGVSASLLEAMTAGLLPIVPNHPANTQWISDGDNGILLRHLSLDNIVDAIQRGIEDVTLRRRAWSKNLHSVRMRGDLFNNAQIFFKALGDLTISTRGSRS